MFNQDMLMRITTIVVLAALVAISGSSARARETSTKVAPLLEFGDVVSNATKYDGKVVRIRAKVSDEFADFTLFDVQCYEKPDIWIELGGDSQCKTLEEKV